MFTELPYQGSCSPLFTSFPPSFGLSSTRVPCSVLICRTLRCHQLAMLPVRVTRLPLRCPSSMLRWSGVFGSNLELTAEFVKHLAPQRRRRTNGWDLPFDPQRHRRDWSLVAGFLGEKHRSKTCHMRSLRGDPLVPILLGSWRFFCSGLRLGVLISHDGSMVLLYMVTWIPSIYPLYVSINIPAPWIRHGFRGDHCYHPAGNHELDRRVSHVQTGWW